MTERDALLRAICDEPCEDTPRLVYADWLDERDEHELAEFIRLQCELQALIGERGIDHVSLVLKRNRESSLLARNRERWSRWPCPECGETGIISVPDTQPMNLFGNMVRLVNCKEVCSACSKSGDLFHSLKVHFRRGFPYRVEVPDMGRVCWRADMLAPASMGEHAIYVPDSGNWQPTSWLRAVARHTTIEEVWVMDRVPGMSGRVEPLCYWGKNFEDEPFNLPAPIFDALPGIQRPRDIQWPGARVLKYYPAPDAARSVAGRAWVEWARKEEVRG